MGKLLEPRWCELGEILGRWELTLAVVHRRLRTGPVLPQYSSSSFLCRFHRERRYGDPYHCCFPANQLRRARYRLIEQSYRFEEHSSGAIAEPNVLGLRRGQSKVASGHTDGRTALPKNLDNSGSARILSPGTRALDVNTSGLRSNCHGERELTYTWSCQCRWTWAVIDT